MILAWWRPSKLPWRLQMQSGTLKFYENDNGGERVGLARSLYAHGAPNGLYNRKIDDLKFRILFWRQLLHFSFTVK
ncbi:unnamed protein product [Calypogeia fissa]